MEVISLEAWKIELRWQLFQVTLSFWFTGQNKAAENVRAWEDTNNSFVSGLQPLPHWLFITSMSEYFLHCNLQKGTISENSLPIFIETWYVLDEHWQILAITIN